MAAPCINIVILNRPNELPAHVFADLLPDLVVFVEFVAVFEERKGGQKLVELQQFAKLVEHVRVIEEVAPLGRTVALKGRLNFAEHEAEFLLVITAHNWRILTIKAIEYMSVMFIVFIQFQFLENIAEFTGL